MIKLIIEDDEGKTTVVPLIRDEITIGRKEGNTIRLTERNVSRRHAKLLKQNGAVFIEDLNSYNGIKVNGNRIAGRVAVAEGDRIQIGDYVLGLKLEGMADSIPPATLPTIPTSTAQSTMPTLELSSRTADALLDTRPEPRQESRPPTLGPLEDEEPAAPPEAQPRVELVGRLVCVSTNFPGQEWLLERQNIVVGRTEDNDVVINHRSISRHHARITEENGHYTITDLQSSNGVRVNGEEYGKVELRRGDLIDLGHVRLRFVAAGEDFVFERDASVVDISKASRPRGGLYVTVLLIALAAAGLVVWYFRRGEGWLGVLSDSTRSAAPDLHAGASSSAPEPSELVATVSRLLASEQWSEAIRTCDSLSGEAQGLAEANCLKARLELQAREEFEAARKASMNNRYFEVLEHRNKIPPESVYKSRDLEAVQVAKTRYLAQAYKDLDELTDQGECQQAEELAERIKEIEPTEADQNNLEAALARCAAKAGGQPNPPLRSPAVKPRPKVRRTPLPVAAPQPAATPPALAPADRNRTKELYDKAFVAYGNGNYAQAIQLLRQVLKLEPTNVAALAVLGACSCYVKDQQQAKLAYERLPAGRRNSLRNVCQRLGITLE